MRQVTAIGNSNTVIGSSAFDVTGTTVGNQNSVLGSNARLGTGAGTSLNNNILLGASATTVPLTVTPLTGNGGQFVIGSTSAPVVLTADTPGALVNYLVAVINGVSYQIPLYGVAPPPPPP